MKDFPGIHDVVRIKCLLDGSHHVDGAVACLRHQEVHLVQTNAVLTGAGAAQTQGSTDQFVVEVFSNFSLFWDVGIDQINEVKFNIAYVADQ